MSVADAVVKSMKAHQRKPSDFYPTPPEGTAVIIPVLRSLGVVEGDTVGEPCCGNGAMARVLERDGGYNVIASDIRHTGYGLGGYDYLKGGNNPREGSFGALAEYGLLDAIVMNPPFDVAQAFILKAVQQAPVVAVLLKSNYWNSKRGKAMWSACPPTHRFDLTWRLAFLEKERGKAPLMDCTWFVWHRDSPPLPYEPLAKPEGVAPLEPLLSVALADLGFAVEALTEAVNALRD